ncbi:unnamed protein product [marine sediment metagenome]|uniref:Uncharacterized protein n=1 Tax=marine sediment metagenome TaxID=412755 RepID=X0VHH8_9ZZZZ
MTTVGAGVKSLSKGGSWGGCIKESFIGIENKQAVGEEATVSKRKGDDGC